MPYSLFHLYGFSGGSYSNRILFYLNIQLYGSSGGSTVLQGVYTILQLE